MSAIDQLAARIVALERHARTQAISPQLAYSAIEDGAIHEYTIDDSLVQIIGAQYDGTHMAAPLNGPNPPVPTEPDVTDGIDGTLVRWDGEWVTALVAPMDFARVEIHASTNAGDTFETSLTLRDTIETARGGEVFIPLATAGPWYIAFVARSLSGKASEPSGVTEANPTMLSAVLAGVGGTTTYRQASAPTGAAEGDFWLDSDDGNKLYRYESGAWVAVQDAAIAAALAAAATAEATADSKVRIFVQTAAPTGMTTGDVGDMWIETDDGNKIWTWSGTAWVARSLSGAAIAPQGVGSQQLQPAVLGKNLAPNPSFEEDWGWVLNPTGVGTTVAYDSTLGLANSGARIIKMTVPSNVTACHFVSDVAVVQACKPNQEYRVIANAAASVASTGDGFYVRPRWYTSAKVWISDSATDVDTENQPLTPEYQEFASTYTSPANAAYVGLVVHYSNPTIGASSAYVDDVAIIEVGPGASQLTSAGLKVWDGDGTLVIDLTSKLTGRFLNIADPVTGESLASIDRTGKGSFLSVDAGQELTVRGLPFIGPTDETPDNMPGIGMDAQAGWLDALPWGVVEWGQIIVQSQQAGTTLLGVMEVDWDQVFGRLYMVTTSPLRVRATAAGPTYEVVIIYTTNDVAPNVTTSAQLARVHGTAVDASVGDGKVVTRLFGNELDSPRTIRPIRMALALRKVSGTGNVYLEGNASDPITMWIEDVGPFRPNSGQATLAGGTPASGSGTTPTTSVKTYTTTWGATSSSSYNGSGSNLGGPEATQGYYSATNGNQRGVICFPSVTAALAGATVKKVEVYLYFEHWYNNSGGTAVIGTHPFTSLPGSFGIGDTNVVQDIIRSGNWPKPGGRWVTLPSSTHAGFQSGSRRGILLGPGPSTSKEYYGRARGNGQSSEPQLRITYTK